VNKPLLYSAIALTGILLGIFHYKLKPAVDDKALQNYADTMRGRTMWRGQIAPDFELTGSGHFKLSDYVGKKVIVLNFFATWCGPCRAEMPELNRYYQEHRDQDFILFGIDAEEKQDRVVDFLKDLKVEFPWGIDQGPVQKQYGVEAFPTSVLIGVDGKIQFYESGALVNAEVAFDNLLKYNRELTASGRAISPSDYARQAKDHPALPSLHPDENKSSDDAPKLSERATHIAEKMDCTCGCDKKVQTCTCHASKKIKDALAKDDFKDMSDDAIVKSLNKRFCPGDM